MKIAFAHNVWNRIKTLKNTVGIEKSFFPDSTHSIAYNFEKLDQARMADYSDVDWVYFGKNQGHKLGCLNGMIHALESAIKHEPDVIIFSHDDVYVNNIEHLNARLKTIDMYDFIGRSFVGKRTNEGALNYVMLESFIITASAAQNVLNKIDRNLSREADLKKDAMGSHSPEMNFGSAVFDSIPSDRLQLFPYYRREQPNELGFHHIERKRGWRE